MAAKNVVVIGGSYVGMNTAESLANASQGRFRVLLIEKNSHFQHLFAFPRYAVTKQVPTHKAFIPYQAKKLGADGAIVQAAAIGLTKDKVLLDRSIMFDGKPVDRIPFVALAITTGTKLSPPSTLPGSEKLAGTTYLRKHAARVECSRHIAVIGAGAVGVQMATDIKEVFPEKNVTLVHSREQIMNKFHPKLHEIVSSRCEELGIGMALGQRVMLPVDGYPTDGTMFDVCLQDGTRIPADFAIICTGQTPQSALLQDLSPSSIDASNFIAVRPTLQISDAGLPHVFALGDIAATKAHKAARPATKQAEVVTRNIVHLLQGEELENYEVTDPAAIHLTLGITRSVVFRNPVGGAGEPTVMAKEDGRMDMGIDGVWARRGADVADAML